MDKKKELKIIEGWKEENEKVLTYKLCLSKCYIREDWWNEQAIEMIPSTEEIYNTEKGILNKIKGKDELNKYKNKLILRKQICESKLKFINNRVDSINILNILIAVIILILSIVYYTTAANINNHNIARQLHDRRMAFDTARTSISTLKEITQSEMKKTNRAQDVESLKKALDYIDDAQNKVYIKGPDIVMGDGEVSDILELLYNVRNSTKDEEIVKMTSNVISDVSGMKLIDTTSYKISGNQEGFIIKVLIIFIFLIIVIIIIVICLNRKRIINIFILEYQVKLIDNKIEQINSRIKEIDNRKKTV